MCKTEQREDLDIDCAFYIHSCHNVSGPIIKCSQQNTRVDEVSG